MYFTMGPKPYGTVLFTVVLDYSDFSISNICRTDVHHQSSATHLQGDEQRQP